MRPAGTPKIDHRSDQQNDPGLCRKSCLIAGREGQEDDNPLPQSDAAPYGRGIANHQSGDIPVRKHRAKVEQRLGLFLASRIPTRQRRPGNQDTGSAEHAGDNKSAAPAQQRSDAAEQERQRRADGERAGVPGCYAGACFPFDAMGKRPQPGHIHACHGNARQAAESERREQAVEQRHSEAGQRAQNARGEIELPGGPPVGQADQRDDGGHIASGGDPREPAGLRIGQRPAGTIEKPARPRISAVHMAATTSVEGAAVQD